MATGFHTIIGGKTIGNLGGTGNVTTQGTFTLPSAPPPPGGATSVKFGQATTSVTSVGQVTISVPSSSRDFWYWPGVSGESFPPTRAAGLNYGTVKGRACYTATTALSPGATFPVVDRISYDGTKTTRVDTFFIYNGDSSANSALHKIVGPFGTLEQQGAAPTTWRYTPPGGVIVNTGLALTYGAWIAIQFTSSVTAGVLVNIGGTAFNFPSANVPANATQAVVWNIVQVTATTAGFDNYSVSYQ